MYFVACRTRGRTLSHRSDLWDCVQFRAASRVAASGRLLPAG